MRKTKKERIKEKRKYILNRKILKKYPFLKIYNRWTGKYMKKLKDLPEVCPDENGWTKAFYWQMMDEIKESLIRTNCMDSFRVDDFKSKYGTMRFYVHGCYKETHDIIDKYEAISANTCEICGKPDVGITDGWITPICKRCYEKRKWETRPYEEAVDPDDMVIRDSYSYTRFSKDGDQTFVINIKDTADKIRARWNKKHKY